MESQRSFLLIGLALVSFLLWQQWQVDYGPAPVAATTQTSTPAQGQSSVDANDHIPVASSATAETPAATSMIAPEGDRKIISVTTDTLNVLIDTKGGDVISASLNQYPIDIDGTEPTEILASNESRLYVAQSGLIGKNGPDSSPDGRPVYQAEKDQFEMRGDRLEVPLTYTKDNVVYKKIFIFEKSNHAITLKYDISNNSDAAITLQQYAQLKQSINQTGGSMFMPTYRGAAYSTQETRYEKFSFDDIEDENLKTSTIGGWVGMLEHYFVSAWIPPQEATNNLYSRLISQQYAVVGYTAQPVAVQPGASAEIQSILYVGPKTQDVLLELARGLDLTVDYGFLWWLAQPLFTLLSFIQSIVINWGLAIIIITIIVKGLMYPLTKAQYESMGKLRALQPKMQALKERHGDDRQKMSQGMMELYKKEKVNPMGGCFPLLLQMPIFLALYWVLLESVELRHADFIFWINDLSVKDPYFVLPVLTGASMYLLQKLNPATIQDPMQQKIMQWMPVFMSIFFLWFPAGLVLYWLISNVITIVQAKIIYNAMEKKGIKTH
ncbi:MAG: membrane protein insertase YidC [Aestuariibacter sp.]